MNKIKGLTLTILANMTSNYGEGLGNVSSVQKVFRNGSTYAMRSRESLKNAIMTQSGMYEDLKVTVDGATQKEVTPERNVANCRALEGGYMNTNVVIDKQKLTFIRNSSFYLTDAISCEPFVNETRFHNNLHLAKTFAEAGGLNVQNNAGQVGLMPYNYEYEKSLRAYSITFDLDMIGVDENFKKAEHYQEAPSEEKVARVNAILEAIEQLSLIVKGNLDNAEPIFVVGGLSDRKTHVFENVVRVNKGRLSITDDLVDKISLGYNVALLKGDNFVNEQEIIEKLEPKSITQFFQNLKQDVKNHYGV